MRYLLDTNICIYLIKRRPESVLSRFEALNVGEIGISAITVYEMVYGLPKFSRYFFRLKPPVQQCRAGLEPHLTY